MEKYTGYKTYIENILNVGNHNIYLNFCINYTSGLNLLLFLNKTKSPNAPLSSLYGRSSVDKKIFHNFMIERTISYINVDENEAEHTMTLFNNNTYLVQKWSFFPSHILACSNWWKRACVKQQPSVTR